MRGPPHAYGGLELVVANLGRELSKRGYDVTVFFATENSAIDGCKMVSRGKELGTTEVDWLQAERNAYDMYKKSTCQALT